VGFEPTVGCPTLVFKTSALNRSAISPGPVAFADGENSGNRGGVMLLDARARGEAARRDPP
jgi:hypothetical protein